MQCGCVVRSVSVDIKKSMMCSSFAYHQKSEFILRHMLHNLFVYTGAHNKTRVYEKNETEKEHHRISQFIYE